MLKTRQIGPCFAGEVSGIDLSQPLSPEDVAAIHAGMDEYAVLVFHGQALTNEQQLAFTQSLGPTRARHRHEPARSRTSSACPPRSRMCPTSTRTTRSSRATTVAGCSPWATACGTPTARSRSMPGEVLAAACAQRTVDGRQHRVRRHAGGVRRARRGDEGTRSRTSICEHSQIYSRQQLGFTDFTDEERERFAPVRQRLVRTHPSTGRKSLFSPRTPARILGWPVPEARAFLRDLVEHATQRQFVYAHQWQVGDLVMWDNRATMHRGAAVPGARAARHAPHHARRRRAHRRAGALNAHFP